MATRLPKSILAKFVELEHHVRRLRLLRGGYRTVLSVLVLAAVALGIEAQWPQGGPGRTVLLAGVVGGTLAAAFLFLLRPWRRPVASADLAAAIEARYPSLAERLSTLVDLAEHNDPANGSPAMIELLARDTHQRARRLNFFRVLSTGQIVRGIGLAIVCGLLALTTLIFVPGTSERARRVLLPWYVPRVVAPYEIQVTSGDVVGRRNDAVTLSAFLRRTGDPAAPSPESVSAIYHETEDGPEKKLPMAGDDKAAFLVTRPGVMTDFRYCIEAGPLRSDWFTVTLADPVELHAQSGFTIEPPAYAQGAVEPSKHTGLAEFEALQYSRVAFQFRLTRPAADATLEWKAADPAAPWTTDRVPVRLAPDRTTATAELVLRGDGTLKLTLTGDHAIKTEVVVATKAKVDTAPRFARVTGLADDGVLEIRPGDTIPLDISVTDDVRLEMLVVEYYRNRRELPLGVVPVTVAGVGTSRAEGRFAFAPANPGEAGDTLHVRLRASDGRKLTLPELRLEPQTAYFPEKGFAQFRLNPSARPLAEQAIVATQKAVDDKLQVATQEVAAARRELEGVRAAAKGQATLPIDQSVRLENARTRIREATRTLDSLAAEVAVKPELRSLAAPIKSLTGGALRQADDAARQAASSTTAAPRDAGLNAADQALANAIQQLQSLRDRNAKLARDRLDRAAIDQLADAQAKLADEAKATADPAQLAEIAQRQAALEQKLAKLLADNDTLKRATDAMATDDARELAARTQALAAKQAAVDRAAEATNAAARGQALADVARRQDELAQRAAELAARTKTAAQVAGTTPLDAGQLRKPGEELARQKPIDALTEQEKSARELDRLAAALETAAAGRADGREAARQLAQLEEELRRARLEAMRDHPAGLPDALRQKQTAEQEALRRATSAIAGGNATPAARQARTEAEAAIDKARDAIAQNRPDADDALSEAAQALRRLSEKLPTRAGRQQVAATKLQALRQKQAELAKSAEAGLTPEQTQALARRQTELAREAAELDPPGQEARAKAAAAALDRAAADLADGRNQDIAASQREARRQLDRLDQALQGRTPPDEAADKLARNQQELDEQVGALDGVPKGALQRELQDRQRELTKQLDAIQDPGAAEQLLRAKDQAAQLQKQLQEPTDADTLKKKSRATATALNDLAEQTARTESAQQAVTRLAQRQQAQADAARAAGNNPTTPDETARANRDVEHQLDELDNLRAGQAQTAKRPQNPRSKSYVSSLIPNAVPPRNSRRPMRWPSCGMR